MNAYSLAAIGIAARGTAHMVVGALIALGEPQQTLPRGRKDPTIRNARLRMALCTTSRNL